MSEDTNQARNDTVQEAASDTQQGGGTLFSDAYVTALRNENAGYRTKAKSYENAVRTVLGIDAGEGIGDLDARVSEFLKEMQAQKAKIENAQKVNGRLIGAAMQSLSGYDQKLLAKLIDLSNVKVAEDGTVTGLKEAAENVRKEYPAVYKSPPPFGGKTQGATQGGGSLKDRANAALREWYSGKG